MAGSKRFYAVYNYGMGVLVRWIIAPDEESIRSVLKDSDWQIYSEDDPNRPHYEGNIGTSILRSPDEWLTAVMKASS